jgi:hypothetical protein
MVAESVVLRLLFFSVLDHQSEEDLSISERPKDKFHKIVSAVCKTRDSALREQFRGCERI